LCVYGPAERTKTSLRSTTKSSKSGQKRLTRREELMEVVQKVKDVIYFFGSAKRQGTRVKEEWRNAFSCNITTAY